MSGFGDDAADASERAVRVAYGRLVAFLATRTRDLAAAEDAVSEALVEALRTWPDRGVPNHPVSWLATVAANRLTDAGRGAERERRLLHSLAEHRTPAESETPADDRLDVLLACAHDAIAADLHTPLMLQCGLGLTAEQIAAVCLVSPANLRRRLTRAKAKIRDAGIRFDLSSDATGAERIAPLLDSLYALFAVGWEGGGETESVAMAAEAILLAEAIAVRLPDHAESLGLLALMHHAHARRRARVVNGRFVPLARQDTARWDAAGIEAGERCLHHAARQRQPGLYQTLAAIQSVHAARHRIGQTNWPAIVSLYDAAVAMQPSLGLRISRAAAVRHVAGDAAALGALDAIAHGPDASRLQTHQPYWAVRAAVLGSLDPDAADAARRHAVGLTTDPAVRAFLVGKQ